MEIGGEGAEASDPLIGSSKQRGSGDATSAQTLGNIVVSIFGTGILGLPYAFRVAGWLAASLGLALAGLLSYYCMLLLVESRSKLKEEAEEAESAEPYGAAQAETYRTYSDVGARTFGLKGRYLTDLLIVTSHAGGSMAYLLFIGRNLSSVFSISTSTSSSSSAFIFLLLLPLEAALSLIRSLSFLAPFSAFATLCNALAMAIVIREDIKRINGTTSTAGSSRTAFHGAGSLPFACGVAVFCFEGFGNTLSLERSMAKRSRFPWVLLLAFTGMGAAYVGFGAFGYFAFGEETDEIITLNLPNNWSAAFVKVGLCIALSFSLPIRLHPIHEIIETNLKSSGCFQKLCSCFNSRAGGSLALQTARILTVVAIAVVATWVPGFAQLVSLTGSTLCAFISFVLPASFHLKSMGSSLNLWRRLVDYIILLSGLVFAGYGAYAATSGLFD